MRNKRRLARVDLRRGAGDGVALVGDENLIAALGYKYRLRVDGHCLSAFHPHPVDFRAAAFADAAAAFADATAAFFATLAVSALAAADAALADAACA